MANQETSADEKKEKPFEESKFKGNVDQSFRVKHGMAKKGNLGGIVHDKTLISSYLPETEKLYFQKYYPFVIYPNDEGVYPAPPLFLNPSVQISMTYYAVNACEGHCYNLMSAFTTQGKNMTARGKHAASLFLMSAIHLSRNMKLDVHRAAIWLSMAWQCFQLTSYYRTREHTHLDRYFEELLIRHCADCSPMGSEVFSEDEARMLQNFFCRFTRLLPLLQLYVFKVFDIELKLDEKRPYLRGKSCSSEMDLKFTETMEDPMLRMDMNNRPKRDEQQRELFKCSMDFFKRIWSKENNEPLITHSVINEFLGILGWKDYYYHPNKR